MPTGQQQGIACHELLHLRRHDWPMVLAEHLVRVLFWFHPAVRLVLDRIHLSREQLVDSEVVCITGQRRAYLEALWNMAKRHTLASPIPALPFLSQNHLLRRVRLLSKEKGMSKLHLSCAIAVLFSAVVATAVAGERLVPLRATSPLLFESPEPFALPIPSPLPEPVPEGRGEKEDIVEPKIKNKVNPSYPDEAKKAGLSGMVKCKALVSKEGQVLEVEIVESTDEVFHQPTIDAVKQWEYHPATKNGNPVKFEMEVTVNYVLR
jgi:TonB family protein